MKNRLSFIFFHFLLIGLCTHKERTFFFNPLSCIPAISGTTESCGLSGYRKRCHFTQYNFRLVGHCENAMQDIVWYFFYKFSQPSYIRSYWYHTILSGGRLVILPIKTSLHHLFFYLQIWPRGRRGNGSKVLQWSRHRLTTNMAKAQRRGTRSANTVAGKCVNRRWKQLRPHIALAPQPWA